MELLEDETGRVLVYPQGATLNAGSNYFVNLNGLINGVEHDLLNITGTLTVNTFVTTKISFANLLARICEQLPGAEQLAGELGPLPPMPLALLIGVTGWMNTARLARSETARLLATEHLRAARVLGVQRTNLYRKLRALKLSHPDLIAP